MTLRVPLTGRPGQAFWLLALVMSAADAKSITAPGKVASVSSAATEIAFVAAAGEPVMYAFGPLLPADATTTTPLPTRVSVATESGLSARPNGAPSDMLTTSIASA